MPPVPSPAVPPSAAPDVVGVVWHEEATVEPGLRQRALAQIEAGSKPGTVVLDGADRRARAIVATEIDREVAQRQVARMAALEAAEAQYRAGESAAALAASDALLEDLRGDPIAPGAVHVLVRLHLLRAQVHAVEGDGVAAEAELRAALHFDPAARVSTRRMPPDLAAMHERIAEQLQREAPTWTTPEVTLGDDALVELDGRAGLRPVPPGPHLVVVRRPGARPVAALVEGPWRPPPPEEILAAGLPVDRAAAQRICDALALRELLLLRSRGSRVGVQAFRCGLDFAQPWFGAWGGSASGIRTALRAGTEAEPAPALLDERAWPQPPTKVVRRPVDDVPKPWFRRGWIWGVVGTVVVGAVVTGAVVGTLPQRPVYGVDAGSFLGK